MVKVWIDITNSPHVLFFEPVIKELKKKRIDVVVTARDLSNTVGLLKQKKMAYAILGKHHGKSKAAKIGGGFWEVISRFFFLLKEKPDILVAHQSPYGMLPARLFGKKAIYVFDNEKATIQNKIAFPFASILICPEDVSYSTPKKYVKKLRTYAGFKEQIYLDRFVPSEKVVEEVDLRKYAYAVVRPEPYQASYYEGRGDKTISLIKHMIKMRIPVVIIARDKQQEEIYREKFGDQIIFPEKEVDGPSLAYYAKAVISGGGTMTREAAILGTPAITTYEGEMLAVDKALMQQGRLFTDYKERKRLSPMKKGNALDIILDTILNVSHKEEARRTKKQMSPRRYV